MAVNQTMLDGLNQMIADGVRQATIDGQTVTYNTTESLIRARNDLREEIRREQAGVSGTVKGSIRRLYYSGRGY